MEYRERSESLGLSDLLLVYHDFLLALSRRTERLIQDFCANGRWMAAGCHNETGSLNPFGYEKSRWLGGFDCSNCCPSHGVLRRQFEVALALMALMLFLAGVV